MRRSLVVIFIVALGGYELSAQSTGEARAAYMAGEYEEAINIYLDVLDEDATSAQARIGLIQALLATGEYEEAVQVGQRAPNSAVVANSTGEALLRLGRVDEAEVAFLEAAQAGDNWSLTARVNLAQLMFDQGRIDEAMQRFDEFIDLYNQANGRLGPRDLVAVARAVEALGRNNPDLFQDALRAFDEAISLDPSWLEARVRLGNLFLKKYDSPSAQEEYSVALAANPNHPQALLGLAKALEFDGTGDATGVLQQLLKINPNNVEAHVLLARRYLTREGHAEGREHAEMALAVNPVSLPALTALAGSHMVAGDMEAFSDVRNQVLAINPRYAEMDASLAELSVQTRRYQQAVERANAAVEIDPSSWTSWGLLGMNELRLGEIDPGRANLERAFEGDPYNPWFKNSLDLLDTFERFQTHTTEHFELFLHETEDELLATYLAPIAEEAYDSLSRRYGVEPDLPVRAELYPSSGDFSVRTLGEVGLGALGVSFGRVLVMDSPTARQLGDYNWASVFWHELAHTFHLAATDNRVPRWFSEGLAVHEQRQAREGWGHQPSLSFLQALGQKRLKQVSELNDGFMRPDYPEQVIHSYYQASLVFQVIEQRWGFGAIREMLDGYRRGETTESLFDTVLKTPLEEFDEDFDSYLEDRFKQPLSAVIQLEDRPGATAELQEVEQYVRAHPGDLLTRLRLGVLLIQESEFDEAENHFEAALRLFPEYGGPDSPYWYLAQIHHERGDLDLAAAALARLNALSESNYQALLMEAELLEEPGRSFEAANVLNKAVLVWPYEMDLHERLAELNTTVGNHPEAVREREAVVALGPVDRADALYLVALAQQDNGDSQSARRSVLRALEIAPNYESALELLLTLQEAN